MTEKPHAYDAYQELAESYAKKIETKPHDVYYDRPAMLSMLPDVNWPEDVRCRVRAGHLYRGTFETSRGTNSTGARLRR